MTDRGKMLEALAHIIFEAMRFDRKATTPDWSGGGNSLCQDEARSKAAAVLDLVGPKKLVWEHDGGVFYTNFGLGRHDYNFDMVTRNSDEPITVYLGQDEINTEDCWTKELAQAAAQSHADAAHWGNTPIGAAR